jgi:enterochelin esterase-like enzyme
MPKHNFKPASGRLEYIEIDSDSLTNNVLGDPTTRVVAVYLPEDYDSSTQEYPLLVDIVGFTNSGLGHASWKPFAESVPQRVDRLVAEGKMGQVIVALPDCFTSLGGNQYINSSALGNWADFLTQDMIEAIESRFRVRKGASHRGIFGKSSGGYGAIVHGMLYSDCWGAIACHSGDMDFELCYRGELPGMLAGLSSYKGGISEFIEKFESSKKVSGYDMHLQMILAMAATYDPDPSLPYGIRLPVTTDTCELIDERWQNWLAWDPVKMIEREDVQTNLGTLKGLYLDCGAKDQYNLVFGARQLRNRLRDLNITHRYEEFADNHSSVDYRMDVSLPCLYDAIS